MLRWIFGADISPFKRGLEEMRGEVKAFSGSVKGMIAGAFGGAAVAAWVSKMVDEFGRIQDLADRLGMSAESIQRIGYAAKLSGSDLETAAKGLTVLTRSIAQAEQGNDELGKAFGVLGINVQEFKALSPEEQLVAISKGFTEAGDRGEGLGAVMKVLGKGGAELIPLLTQGPEALKEQLDEAAVASNEAVKAVANLGDQIDKLKAQGAPVFAWIVQFFQSIGNAIGSAVGVIWANWQTLFDGIGKSAGKTGEIIKKAFSGDFEGAKKAAQELGDIAKRTSEEIGRNYASGKEAFDEGQSQIWTQKHEQPKGNKSDVEAAAEAAKQAEEAAKERKKLEEEIAKLQEDARIRALNLDEQIADAYKRRAELAEKATGSDNAALEAKRDQLKVEEEIAKLEKEKADEADKAQKEADAKAKDLAAVLDREADMRHQMDLDGMSDSDRLKALKADKKASDERAAALEKQGDKKGAAEERIKGLGIQKDINSEVDKAKSKLESLQGIQPVIATSSLQSIGGGGSANLFTSESTGQRMVDLLRVIADNTARRDGGSPPKSAPLP
jgi:hypothetical protein